LFLAFILIKQTVCLIAVDFLQSAHLRIEPSRDILRIFNPAYSLNTLLSESRKAIAALV
jgi:hypothetical protein